jgi:hypothetical protein
MPWNQQLEWFHRSKNHPVVRPTGRGIKYASRAIHFLLIFATRLLVIVSCLLAGAFIVLVAGSDPPRLVRIPSDRLLSMLWLPASLIRWPRAGVGRDPQRGVDHPIDLRISNFFVTDPAGRRLLTAPDAHLTLILAGLILGRIVPGTLEVDSGEFAMTRGFWV